MGSPGSAAGVTKDRIGYALNRSSSLLVINPHPFEYWWSWRRLQHLVNVVNNRGVENGAEWRRLQSICRAVSIKKKKFLLKRFRPLFCESSLIFLFGPEFISAGQKRLDEVEA